jgi:hypothetical protein
VLICLQKSQLALPHLQRAIALNARNQVPGIDFRKFMGCWAVPENKTSLDEFERLRGQKASDEEGDRYPRQVK